MLARIWNHRRSILIGIGMFLVILLPLNSVFAQASTTPSWFTDPMGNIMYLLYTFVLTVFGGLMTLFGYAFDYTIDNFVIGFGDLYINSNLGYIIDDLWSTIRDLFNLGLIFGVVFIGMKLIFNSDDSGAQKMLGSLILAALLVNFSMFIVKFIIDFANVLASQIFQAFVKLDPNASIGTTFVNMLSLSNSLNSEAVVYATAKEGGFLLIFGIMILFLVTAFVFGAGACLLTIRYIALNLYMVFSPLMFLGWVFPKMGRYSSEYWNGFLGRAFFAPAFIFMIYLSFQVIQKYSEGRTIQMNQIFNSMSGSVSVAGETFAFFILAIGFMVSSLIVAQKMGAHGASAAISIGKRTVKSGRSIAGGYAAQKLVRGIDAAASSDPNGPGRYGSRLTARALTRIGARDYLDKQHKGSTLGKMQATNKATKQAMETRDTAARNRRTIETGTSTNAELVKLRERQELVTLSTKPTLTTAETARLTELRTRHTGPAALTAPEAQRLTDLEAIEHNMKQAITKLSVAEIEDMSDDERAAIAPHLTQSQAEKVGESKELSGAQKKALGDARAKAINDIVAANAKDVAKLSVEQLESMGEDFIRTQAATGNLKQSQIDDLKKSKKFTESQRDNFAKIHRAAQSTQVQAKIAAGVRHDQLSTVELESLGAAELISNGVIQHLTKSQIDDLKKSKGLTDDEKRNLEAAQTNSRAVFDAQHFRHRNGAVKSPAFIASLPRNVLMDPQALKFLTPDVLQKIAKEGTLGAADQVALKTQILAATGPDRAGASFFTTNYAIANWG